MAITRENWLRSVVPAGTVIAFAGATPPSGWLLCDGSAISRSTYSALFEAISTAHGSGDGSTTFTLPDYRGRFLRGVANGSTNDPDRASRTHPVTGAVVGDTIGSIQGDQYGSHNHKIVANVSSNVQPSVSNYIARYGRPSVEWYDIMGSTTAPTLNPTETVGGSESRPKNANVNYIIKA